MLRAGRMEEFVTEEEEPWYDQRDLEQGEASFLLSQVCEGGSHHVTMDPQSWDSGINGFIQEGVGGEEGGGCIQCKTHYMHECTHYENCTSLPALHFCSLLLPIILILSVVFPRIVLLCD